MSSAMRGHQTSQSPLAVLVMDTTSSTYSATGQYSEALQHRSRSISYLCSCAARPQGSGTAAVGTVVRMLSRPLQSLPSPVFRGPTTKNLCAQKKTHIVKHGIRLQTVVYMWQMFIYGYRSLVRRLWCRNTLPRSSPYRGAAKQTLLSL